MAGWCASTSRDESFQRLCCPKTRSNLEKHMSLASASSTSRGRSGAGASWTASACWTRAYTTAWIIEYWIRMALAGARFKRVDQVMAFFRLSPGSKTVGQTAAHAEEQYATLGKVLADPGPVQQAWADRGPVSPAGAPGARRHRPARCIWTLEIWGTIHKPGPGLGGLTERPWRDHRAPLPRPGDC